MFLFGINFNLYYLIIIKKAKSVFKSGELWAYISISGVAIAIICLNTLSIFDNFGEALRASAFQVSSYITSTGYATVNANTLPTLSKTVLVILMFIGACAGSTGGGFKVARIVMLVKMIKQELRRIIHPRSVTAVKFEGKVVDSTTLNSVSSYLAIYLCFFIGIFLIISFESFGFETNFTATLSCINNIGPIFSQIDPNVTFANYTPFSKIVLSFAMLFGRLEIYPLLIALTPTTWTKK
jgi:trk system potassium uptake protein TrkH